VEFFEWGRGGVRNKEIEQGQRQTGGLARGRVEEREGRDISGVDKDVVVARIVPPMGTMGVVAENEAPDPSGKRVFPEAEARRRGLVTFFVLVAARP
jgi:hypothetical protein